MVLLYNNTVKLWDTRAAVPLHTITRHTAKVNVKDVS